MTTAVIASAEFSTCKKTRIIIFTLPFDGKSDPWGLLIYFGAMLAIFLLWLYPLYGKYLGEVGEILEKKRELASA